MCGRYVRKTNRGEVADWFHADDAHVPQFWPSYNVAPQTFQPVVRLSLHTGQREIVLMRWGFVPHSSHHSSHQSSKDSSHQSSHHSSKDARVDPALINAKAETIALAPSFREAIKRRRCLVPADAFYEWQKTDTDTKTERPFAIALKDGAHYAFAGIWERWKDPKGPEPLDTFSIITTEANELIRPFEDRMPVIIAPGDYRRWLSPGDPHHLPLDLLRPFPADQMTAWEVDARVGNVKNNDERLLEAVSHVGAPPAALK
jgi:putative SOS response-associated peptidase YedK